MKSSLAVVVLLALFASQGDGLSLRNEIKQQVLKKPPPPPPPMDLSVFSSQVEGLPCCTTDVGACDVHTFQGGPVMIPVAVNGQGNVELYDRQISENEAYQFMSFISIPSVCKPTCMVCPGSKGTWVPLGSGTSMSMTVTVTYSDSKATTNSQTITNSMTAGMSASFKGIGGSASYTHSNAQTYSTTNTLTASGSKSIQVTTDCQGGVIYQWVVETSMGALFTDFTNLPNAFSTSPNPLPPGSALPNYMYWQNTTVNSQNFICLPTSLPGGTSPKCPANFCYNTQDSGTGAGCQCCNSLSWAEDPSSTALPSVC